MKAISVSSRFHLFARPADLDAMRRFCSDVLGCTVREHSFPGMNYPVMLVVASEGSFSIEFRDDAAESEALKHSLYLEFIVSDREETQARLRAADVPEFRHEGSPHAYFRMPNGQVFRVISPDQLNAP